MKPSLLLLAAGMGSRYGGLKQIDAFGPHGESILDYSIYDALQCGFEKFIFIIREEIRADFEKFFKGKFPDHVEVHFVAQKLSDIPAGYDVHPDRVKPWGTAHAVYAGRQVVNEPVGVINADDYYGREALQSLYDYLSEVKTSTPQHMCTVSYHLGNTLSDHGTVNRGICKLNDHGHLISITERKGIGTSSDGVISCTEGDETIILASSDLASMNMFGLTELFFTRTEEMLVDFLEGGAAQLKSELYIPEVVTDLIASGTMVMDVLDSEGEWFGVTYQEDKPHVESRIASLISEGVYPAQLWS